MTVLSQLYNNTLKYVLKQIVHGSCHISLKFCEIDLVFYSCGLLKRSR